MARNYIIAGNWKMNITPSEAKQLIADIIASVGQKPDTVEVVVLSLIHI